MLTINLVGIHEQASHHFFELLEQVGVIDDSSETKKWTEILSSYTQHASNIGSDYFSGDEDSTLDDFYRDMNLEKSDKYIVWFDTFSEIMSAFGDVEYESDLDDMPPQHNWWVDECPWEPSYSDTSGSTYLKLKETGDFFWFLIVCIQRLGSVVGLSWRDIYSVKKVLVEVSQDHKDAIDWSIFYPLNSWISAKSLESSFKKRSLKSVSKDLQSINLNLEEINAIDVHEIPEFDLEENYIRYENNYYEVGDVVRAITASGGLAQSLERQDLEPKVTTVNSLLKKKKKIKVKNNENRKN